MGVNSQVVRYLDRAAASLFRRSRTGQVLFFPFGGLGRGRVVLDQATGAELRTGVRHAWIAFACVLLPLLAVFVTLKPNVLILLAFVCLALLEYLVFMATLVIGLEISGHRIWDCDRSCEPPSLQQALHDV